MPEPGFFVYAAVALAIAIGWSWWGRSRARDAAARWLERHGYRVRSLRTTWGSMTAFGPQLRLVRRNEQTVVFRATVADRRLGGTGVVLVRVRVGAFGGIDEDAIEVSWERMPDPYASGPAAPDAGWLDAQLALLRRVVDGETTFRPAAAEPAGEAFDVVVEHLLALQRRGLATCATPLADLRGPGQYVAVTNVALTPEGERVVAGASAAGRRPVA
jgi:hypothetical protein